MSQIQLVSKVTLVNTSGECLNICIGDRFGNKTVNLGSSDHTLLEFYFVYNMDEINSIPLWINENYFTCNLTKYNSAYNIEIYLHWSLQKEYTIRIRLI